VIRGSRIKGAITLTLYAAGIALAPFVPGAVLATAGLAAALYFVPTAPK
jgi:hypothetical protein